MPEGETEESLRALDTLKTVAKLEERLATESRGRQHLKGELEKLTEEVDELKKLLTCLSNSKKRIGGVAEHESHHRHIQELLQRRKERRNTVLKLRDDLLSKGAILLLGFILTCLMYLYNKLPLLIGIGS